MSRNPDRDAESARLVASRIHELCTRYASGNYAEFGRLLGVPEVTARRWCIPPKEGGTTPKITDAVKIHDATGATLDSLVGRDADPASRLASAAEHVDHRVDEIRRSLDLLLTELADARSAVRVGVDGVDAEAAAAERAERRRQAVAEEDAASVARQDS